MTRARRALRRAGKVSIGAARGALACVVRRGRRRRRRVVVRRARAAPPSDGRGRDVLVLASVARDPARAVRAAVGARAARVDVAGGRRGSRRHRARARAGRGRTRDHRGHGRPALAGVSAALRDRRVRRDGDGATRRDRDARRRAVPRGRAVRAHRHHEALRVTIGLHALYPSGAAAAHAVCCAG